MSSTMPSTQQQQQQPHCRQDSYDEEIYTEFRQPVTENQRLVKDAIMESPRKLDSAVSSPPPPPLPRKNALRSGSRSRSTSRSSSTRTLDTTGLNIGGAKEIIVQGTTGATKEAAPTPHDVYLSSEEDASSSADDFSDFEWESGSEFEYADDAQIAEASSSSGMSSPSGGPRRRSHEITARVVSVIYVGKPAIVNLSTPSKRTSPSPTRSTMNVSPTPSNTSAAPAQSSLSSSRRRSVSAATSFARRLSISSTASFSPGVAPATATPVKAKNVIASVFTRKGQQPLFLNTDPFANNSAVSIATPPRRTSSRSVSNGSPAVIDEAYSVRTPKTPTEKFKDFSLRGGALLKKRSRSIMNAAHSLRDSYNGAGVAPLPEENGDSSRDTSRASTPASTPYDRTQSSMDYFSSPAASAAARALPVRAQSDMALGAPISPTEMKGSRFTGLSARRRSFKSAGRP
ncbi:hypothetical protein MCOR27_003063 [Pyricularia oryzae]|nr:hypothetical protein MCOR19_004036 [Pyricularia oryzae]KAI6283870.1 hypothetical protein MCOR27_003063 [Pyricularia oryzae]KAI6341191.1 hypothetical protein MCOR30_002226 [Pyricularia oryzae]KAI6386790.1 hypothetical protein MCOR23_011325 [Pyricularia oryzae]KAI6463443.1 hypothetical protein MCOR18_010720 [Pyricularia oryzae]